MPSRRTFVPTLVATALCLLLHFARAVTAATAPEPSDTLGEPLPMTQVALGTPPLPSYHQLNSSFFTSPVPNPLNISSTFGPRWKIGSGRDDFHRGIDYSGSAGDPITCAAGGASVWQVVPDGTSSSFPNSGNVVVLKHELFPAAAGYQFHGRATTQVFTYYMHLDSFDASIVNASQGDPVALGQQIGRMGQTGDAVSVHLHFETRLVGYCSYQFQFENNRVPSSTSSCNTGFDPHVHPYLFVGGANQGSKNVTRVVPLNASYAAAVSYCTDRGHLDLDTIESNFGTVNYDTRAGMNVSTIEQLDDLSHITPWLTLRPLLFGTSRGVWCAELHFWSCPTHVALYDIHGAGVRVDLPASCAVAGNGGSRTPTPPHRNEALTETPQSVSASHSASESPSKFESVSKSAAAPPPSTPPTTGAPPATTRTVTSLLPPPSAPPAPRTSTVSERETLSATVTVPVPTPVPAPSGVPSVPSIRTRTRTLPPMVPPVPPHTATVVPPPPPPSTVPPQANWTTRSATQSRTGSATRDTTRAPSPPPRPPPAPPGRAAATDNSVDVRAAAIVMGITVGALGGLIAIVLLVATVALRARNVTWREAIRNITTRDRTKYTKEFAPPTDDADIELLGNQRDVEHAPSDAATGGGASERHSDDDGDDNGLTADEQEAAEASERLRAMAEEL